MSVYTAVQHGQLVTYLKQYSIGELLDFQGISSGIENTNYFVTTTQGEYVLTLFEELKAEELPYFLKIMNCVSTSGVPSARPVSDQRNNFLNTLNGKPAAIVEKLAGGDIEHPNDNQCATLGDALAKLHLAVQELSLHRENSRGHVWRQQAAELLMPLVDDESSALIKDELNAQLDYNSLPIPTGIIHADLFKDNALFSGDKLSGIIDFYYACNDYLMYDIAVAANDWCIGENSLLDTNKFDALITAYQAVRPFTDNEIKYWPTVIRAAAFRFWLSRLRDVHFPKEGEITHLKNPEAMKNVLIARRNSPQNYCLA